MSAPRKFNVWAVLIGFGVIILGSMGWGFFAFVIIIALVMSGHQPSAIAEHMQASPFFLTLGLGTGSLLPILGGFIAARVAKVSEILHALAVGILSLLLGVAGTLLMKHSGPGWFQAASFILVVPAAVLGGYFRLMTKGR